MARETGHVCSPHASSAAPTPPPGGRGPGQHRHGAEGPAQLNASASSATAPCSGSAAAPWRPPRAATRPAHGLDATARAAGVSGRDRSNIRGAVPPGAGPGARSVPAPAPGGTALDSSGPRRAAPGAPAAGGRQPGGAGARTGPGDRAGSCVPRRARAWRSRPAHAPDAKRTARAHRSRGRRQRLAPTQAGRQRPWASETTNFWGSAPLKSGRASSWAVTDAAEGLGDSAGGVRRQWQALRPSVPAAAGGAGRRHDRHSAPVSSFWRV
jgi:hypothetical protein